MAKIKAFKGYRPNQDFVSKIASVPYDVVNTEEARALAEGNPDSFLRVVRSEIEFDEGQDAYAPEIYQRAKDNLESLIKDGKLIQEDSESVYLYQVQMGEHIQTGIVALSSVDEYDKDLVKKHEKTRPVKENDRTRHVVETGAHTGPVFLTYKAVEEISALVAAELESAPLYDFTADDGIRHALWKAENPEKLISAFGKVPCTYVADGHHRAASASRCRKELQEKNPSHTGQEAYNYFLSVLFPDSELDILPYNRIIKTKNGQSTEEILEKISSQFDITKGGSENPASKGELSLFIEGSWYALSPKDKTLPEDVVERLEVSLLSNKILKPIFNIQDERTDENIDFVGGIRGTKHLEDLVNSGKAECAFSVYATSIAELMEIADANQIMAPKSTWFEPKLRSGLVIHKFA